MCTNVYVCMYRSIHNKVCDKVYKKEMLGGFCIVFVAPANESFIVASKARRALYTDYK